MGMCFPHFQCHSALLLLIIRARIMCKLMRTDRAWDRGMLQNCFVIKMKERRWK